LLKVKKSIEIYQLPTLFVGELILELKIPSSTGFCGLSLKPHFLGKIDGFLGVFA